MSTPAYPLAWPTGWKRTAPAQRRDANFTKYKKRLSVSDGTQRVRLELERMLISENDLVISTDLKLRMDGFPRSDQAEPSDPGAAVYWIDRKKAPRAMAIDRYTRVADNLAAIAATLEALRAVERHGGGQVLERAFAGFVALPAPATELPWFQVLGVAETAEWALIEEAWKRRRSETHPQNGGTIEKFDAVVKAYAAATYLFRNLK